MRNYVTTAPSVKRFGYIVRVGKARVRIRATFDEILSLLPVLMAAQDLRQDARRAA